VPKPKTDISQFDLLDKVRRSELSKIDYIGYDERGEKLFRLLAAEQSFDAKPTVVAPSEFERLVALGEHYHVIRGVTDATFADAFKTSDMFFGFRRAFGTGIYGILVVEDIAEVKLDAAKFGASLIEIAVPKTNVIETYDALLTKTKKAYYRLESDFKKGTLSEPEVKLLFAIYRTDQKFNPGLYALTKGVEGFIVGREITNNVDYFVILNRGGVYVKA
jgi:hypothetical protein